MTHSLPYPAIDYLTRDFVRNDCAIFGADLSNADCDRMIKQFSRLPIKGISTTSTSTGSPITSLKRANFLPISPFNAFKNA